MAESLTGNGFLFSLQQFQIVIIWLQKVTMRKIISALIMKPGTGFYIDLLDKEISASITPNEGDIILSEGRGRGRVPAGVIPGSKIKRVEVRTMYKGWNLIVHYRGRTHSLGSTSDFESVKAFAERINRLYSATTVVTPYKSKRRL
jgi:hypothetical protein